MPHSSVAVQLTAERVASVVDDIARHLRSLDVLLILLVGRDIGVCRLEKESWPFTRLND